MAPKNSEKIKQSQDSIFQIPPDATNSLYIDGVPNDATDREVGRKYPNSLNLYPSGHQFFKKYRCFPQIPNIPFLTFLDVFRPFPGYICARLISKETKSGRKYYYCFVDFENSVQASICMQTLQVIHPFYSIHIFRADSNFFRATDSKLQKKEVLR